MEAVKRLLPVVLQLNISCRFDRDTLFALLLFRYFALYWTHVGWQHFKVVEQIVFNKYSHFVRNGPMICGEERQSLMAFDYHNCAFC